jgi:hypothetical protein
MGTGMNCVCIMQSMSTYISVYILFLCGSFLCAVKRCRFFMGAVEGFVLSFHGSELGVAVT